MAKKKLLKFSDLKKLIFLNVFIFEILDYLKIFEIFLCAFFMIFFLISWTVINLFGFFVGFFFVENFCILFKVTTVTAKSY